MAARRYVLHLYRSRWVSATRDTHGFAVVRYYKIPQDSKLGIVVDPVIVITLSMREVEVELEA
jgi:hypothetical protein